MIRYLLDTDTVSLLRTGHAQVSSRVLSNPIESLAISAITVEELFTGWFALLRHAKTDADKSSIYERIARTAKFVGQFQIVGCCTAALETVRQLQRQKLNVGSNDLKIAAVSIDLRIIVVTRNSRDFQRVPGIALEDWSRV